MTLHSLVRTAVVALPLAIAPLAAADTITDDFEAASISAFWTRGAPAGFTGPDTGAGPGTETLSSLDPYDGSQSVLLQASGTDPWFAGLYHDFGSGQTGTISIFMRRPGPSSSSAAFGLDDAGLHLALLQENGAGSYLARIYASDPGKTERDIPISFSGPTDWHEIQFQVDSSGLTASLDGIVVATEPSIKAFSIAAYSDWSGPTGSAFFDDFVFAPADSGIPTLTPEPSSGSLAVLAICSGAAISRLRGSRLRLRRRS